MIKKAMFLLIKIGSTSVTQNRSTNITHISVRMYVYMHVCMYVMYACYVCTICCCSNWFHKHYLKFVPQTLLKIDSEVLP